MGSTKRFAKWHKEVALLLLVPLVASYNYMCWQLGDGVDAQHYVTNLKMGVLKSG
ncbi:MAG: hypothetical protein KA516_17645 [Providencia sp.]|nr:hypothetical protein [Providencia sp.]